MSNRKNDWNHKNIWNHGYVTTPQAHLYYEISGHGTPILFLHGNSQSHHIFHSYAHKLQGSYQVILMDSRGHGFSHLKDSWANRLFTIHDMALDVAALLDKLHISKIILFGFSDGANIALEFSSLYPERTLAVISASGNALPHGLRLPIRLTARFTGWIFRTIKKLVPGGPLRQSLTNWQQLNSLLTDSPSLSADRLHQITAPVLLIAGTRDLIKTSHTTWMASQIPDCQLYLVEGGTHQVIFLRESECWKVIWNFLKNIPPLPMRNANNS